MGGWTVAVTAGWHADSNRMTAAKKIAKGVQDDLRMFMVWFSPG
jgi:hypothetical protein